MNTLFFALWFFVPAGVANVTPIFAAHLPFLKKYNQPIDFGLSIGGKRIFGDHKTIRGFVSGVLVGTLTAVAQEVIVSHFPLLQNTLPANYLAVNMFVLGLLLSAGALLGDMIKSFFKRRVNVTAGKAWIPFDQIDYIVGGILLSWFVVKLAVGIYAEVLLLWFGIHIVSTYIGYFLRLKESPL